MSMASATIPPQVLLTMSPVCYSHYLLLCCKIMLALCGFMLQLEISHCHNQSNNSLHALTMHESWEETANQTSARNQLEQQQTRSGSMRSATKRPCQKYHMVRIYLVEWIRPQIVKPNVHGSLITL